VPTRVAPEEIVQRDLRTNALLAQLYAWGLLALDAQTCSWDISYGRYTWNATRALVVIAQIAHRLRPTPQHQLEYIAHYGGTDAAHVQRVDPTQPGIVAMYFDFVEGGWRAVVIDGNHRAVRAYETGQPFACYELTPVESWALLLEHPVAGESVFYAEHLCCPPDCMIQMDADRETVNA